MKFHQLAVGSHFSFQQKRYCKTSPLAATAEDGSQRMIPRAALVVPEEKPGSDRASRVNQSPLIDILQRHHQANLELLGEVAAHLPEVQRQELLKKLEDNFRGLLADLPDNA